MYFATGDSKAIGFSDELAALIGFAKYDRMDPGDTAVDFLAGIETSKVVCGQTPERILINLGTGDMRDGIAPAATEAAFEGIFDNLHAEWPEAHIYAILPWRRGFNAESAAMGTSIAGVVAARSPWAHVGPDECIFLENGDNGVTFTADGIHPNAAGYTLTASEWQTILGL